MDEEPVHLLNATKDQWPQTILRGVWGLYRDQFPDHIRSLYILGSRMEDTAASISDIDGCIIFKAGLSDVQKKQAESMMANLKLISPYRLDLDLVDSGQFEEYCYDVRLKLGGELVFGEDIRDEIPLPSVALYQEHIAKWPKIFMRTLHDVKQLTNPLVSPEPEDEYLGYTKKRAHSWYPAEVDAGTKELVAGICWAATARLGLEKGVFVATRAESVRLYQEHIGDEWALFIERAYQKCKRDWDYRVPTEESGRAELREICRQALVFFNVYVQKYGT